MMKTIHFSASNRIVTRPVVALVILVLVLAFALPGLASEGEVTRGAFQTYASGPALGYDISGHARMTRTADGKTLVSTHAAGLLPNTSYGVHVHNQACSNGNGGGHYQEAVGGPVDPYNEIWPLFTTDEQGVGNGKAVHAFYARPEAQAVVIHAPGGARIACADLK
jgi:Cu/Zn superoxide dismutase